MVQKEIRKYDLIVEICTNGGAQRLRELATLDFTAALDIWEYIMGKDPNTFGDTDVFAILEDVSAKNLRAFLSGGTAGPLLKLIYGASQLSCIGANLKYLCDLIVGSKIDAAEEILRMVRGNATGDFNERMVAVVDKVFELSMAKNGTGRATLNHKQTILLFDFVSKMKSGASKNLLTQRIKEL